MADLAQNVMEDFRRNAVRIVINGTSLPFAKEVVQKSDAASLVLRELFGHGLAP